MTQSMVAILETLRVSLDTGSTPFVNSGVINWLGRTFNVSPYHTKLGLIEGMEIWTSESSFAPLDLEGVERWLIDIPRGSHLLICRNKVMFNMAELPRREGIDLVFWSHDDIANFVGHAVLDGIIDVGIHEEKATESEDASLFSGRGPHTLKAKNDFLSLEEYELDINLSKPVLLPAKLHFVTGMLRGPEDIELATWVLNCGGLHLLYEIEIMDKTPLLKQKEIKIDANPNFVDLLSERRVHKDGMGDLLRWYRFDKESENVETHDVLVPAYIGSDNNGEDWIFNAVLSKIQRNF